MENIITQVSPDGTPNVVNNVLQDSNYGQDNNYYNQNQNEEYGNSLIHLNIQENHYFITRDQLMSLPESLLLCLFPSGVFLDRDGQVITNLTPGDEVYITNFSPECFEYIMDIFTKAHEDLINHPVEKLFAKNQNNSLMNTAKGFFGFNSSNNSSSTNLSGKATSDNDLLHQKPIIIVLREDLDYYCVPQEQFTFNNLNDSSISNEQKEDDNNDLLQHFMAQVKIAAGSYLTSKKSIFQGLYSSNRLKYQNKSNFNITKPSNNYSNNNNKDKDKDKNNNENITSIDTDKKLGPAEQHLMNMLCSSGFNIESTWGDRTQEVGKTVISSLSLCRLENESTQQFRDKLSKAKANWQLQHPLPSDDEIDGRNNSRNKLTPTNSSRSLTNFISYNRNKDKDKDKDNSKNNTISAVRSATTNGIVNSLKPTMSNGGSKRRSRLATLTDSVRSNNTSRGNSLSRNSNNNSDMPKVYDLVPKPDINAKLLLFWRKPARKCWWGDEEVELPVEIYGNLVDSENRIINLKLPTDVNVENELNKVIVPVRLHIRRVWTLELSVIGVQ